MRFILRGAAFTGGRTIPLETEIQAPSSEEAVSKAQAEADRMFLIERNAVRLEIFGEHGVKVGEVLGPSGDCPRPCESHTTLEGKWGRCPKPARYRESYYDSSSEYCEGHLMEENQRKTWYAEGLLEGIYDLQRKVSLHPVTLQPLRPELN